MALIVNRCLCHILYRRMAHFKSYLNVRTTSDSANNGSNTVDIMDEFTNQLMQRKVNKWSIKIAAKLVREDRIIHKKHSYIVEHLNVEAINSFFQEAINSGDNSLVMDLMEQCMKYRKCPSLSNLNYVLRFCSIGGDKDMIVRIKQFCEELYPEILPQNSNFDHYVAEALWVKGNVREGLKLFEEVYENNPFLRRRIRLALKYLIRHSVLELNEAALVNLVKSAERLAQLHNDYFPLMCIWEACCLSEWFADQELAMELLRKNDNLCKAVASRIQYVVSVCLHTHRTEIVYRLLETLLKNDLKEDYSGILISLFDYQLRMGDTRGCSEIIQWCIRNNVEVPPLYNEEITKLLLLTNLPTPELKKKLEAAKELKIQPTFKF